MKNDRNASLYGSSIGPSLRASMTLVGLILAPRVVAAMFAVFRLLSLSAGFHSVV